MKTRNLVLGSALVAAAFSAVSCGKMASMPGMAGSPSYERSAAYEAPPGFNTESYSRIDENDYLAVKDNPLSTFSIDVDTASYSNARRFLNDGSMPVKDAVRIEELINYFSYAYPEPQGDAPFSVSTETSAAPWNPKHRLMRIGLQGKRIAASAMPPRNLVFLVDVSGSMEAENKLPLVKRSLTELVGQLTAKDSVALTVYAGSSGLVLPPTRGDQRAEIISALDRLSAGGSTNGGEGIQLAYSVAQKHFDPNGINRVIVATDGDFNVGVTNEGDLTRLIEKQRESGVYLTVLGFGMGNYKDSSLEKLADKGNGNYAYIDDIAEARKVLVQQGGSTLITIAKDVKIQVEFNPRLVSSYRLIGYENRLMRKEEFNDDKKDAGEIGAGHSVTALYEVVPADQQVETGDVDALKYQKPTEPSAGSQSNEMATVKLRFKRPKSDVSELLSQPVVDDGAPVEKASAEFRFAAAVAGFGMLLRESKHRGNARYSMVAGLAQDGLAHDPNGYRREFLVLVGKARKLAGEKELTAGK